MPHRVGTHAGEDRSRHRSRPTTGEGACGQWCERGSAGYRYDVGAGTVSREVVLRVRRWLNRCDVTHGP